MDFLYELYASKLASTPTDFVRYLYNKNGLISMKEAFEYAKKEDSKNENPQYESISPSLGNHLTLYGNDCATIYVKNQTIASNNAYITGCDINISNITIENQSSVTIKASESATINGPCEVELGSTFEIK